MNFFSASYSKESGSKCSTFSVKHALTSLFQFKCLLNRQRVKFGTQSYRYKKLQKSFSQVAEHNPEILYQKATNVMYFLNQYISLSIKITIEPSICFFGSVKFQDLYQVFIFISLRYFSACTLHHFRCIIDRLSFYSFILKIDFYQFSSVNCWNSRANFLLKYFIFIILTNYRETNQLNWVGNKIIFTCLFNVHIIISLSRHEQLCLMKLSFEKYFSHHRTKWLKNYLSKRSLMKHACSCLFKFIVVQMEYKIIGFPIGCKNI